VASGRTTLSERLLPYGIGGLPALEIVELAFAAASAVGRLVANGVDWRTAQPISTALPDPEWPDGLPVVTAIPKQYARHGIEAVPVSSN